MKTPARNQDIKDLDTGLSPAEKRDMRRAALIDVLGVKYALHPANSPAKGNYDRHGKRIA